ncbi:MAG TPA: HAMP domain-containing sensor histidine kinase [Acidimicrobiales bacterium]|jgi:two-component system OmpR family sensor kinase
MRRLSLRQRLLGTLVLLFVVGFVVSDVASYRALQSFLFGRVDQQLTALNNGLTRGLLVSGRLDRGALAGVFFQVRDSQGGLVVSGNGNAVPLGAGQAFTPRLPDPLPAPGPGNNPLTPVSTTFDTQSSQSGGPSYRVRVTTLPGLSATTVVALPLGDVSSTLSHLRWIELAVTGAVIALAVLVGLWLVRISFRPLDDIAETAGAIAKGELDRRIPGTEPRTEIGRLGIALNAMLARIEAAFAERKASEERLRRFVADASHELRTPLTSIRGYAELFRRGADRRPEDLAMSMQRIEDEATRMGALVDDLLLLARLDQGRPLDREPVDLAAVVGQAVEAAHAVEPERPLSFAVDSPVTVVGDPRRLRQVVDNLLANVRTHTPPGCPASVKVGSENGNAVLEVADEGPGIDPVAAERVFERFYRADESRSRDNGGVGLGLSIVAAITDAHGGRVRAGPRDGGGASFLVELPRQGAGPAALSN